jgi:predicted anti-sigma-YlaC factor YlaD
MGKCKNITRLLSDALDRSLTTGEWVAIRLHLPTCSGCRNYRKQIRLLRTAAQVASGIAAADGARGAEDRED